MSEASPPRAATQIVVASPSGNSAIAAATSIVDALRGQPFMLVFVILTCFFIGAATWFMFRHEENRHDEWVRIIDRCVPQAPGVPITR